MGAHTVESAQVVLPCNEPISATIDFFTSHGFAVRTIMPADHPRMVVLNGHGLTVRLEVGANGTPGRLRLLSNDVTTPYETTAPNGTVFQFVPAQEPLVVPKLVEEFVVTRAPVDSDDDFGEGRAGLRYRDLIPSRLGGRFIASHILIAQGGPVNDYVHFHNVRFQMIYCHRGWVRVAYEDQGEPMLMHEGDCFLQPSTIRHRVLEASDRMQVIEIGCPAEHETWADPDTTLPTGSLEPDRGFGADGHRFVFHQAASATWVPSRFAGYETRDTGIGAATDGVAGVRVLRPIGNPGPVTTSHQSEFQFHFVLDGALTVQRDGDEPMRLHDGDSFVVPANVAYTLSDPTADAQLLDVTLPA
ncbi:MAG: cupin domain-containing protein [Actinomycetia bacterium]|nr:cupin domain-containing protein [Actinomycetes bacterium]